MTAGHPRRDYHLAKLDESLIRSDPYDQLQQWLTTAMECEEIDEPTAMTIATVDSQCRPSVRTVLARYFDKNGIVFFTNYRSKKGNDISHNPSVACLFYWGPLERQLRIEGTVHRVESSLSDEYFSARPHKSKLAANLSPQSQVIPNRDSLDSQLEDLLVRYPEGSSVTRPSDWGGYRITAHQFEFWQGRPNRLHDRIRYTLVNNKWVIDRLAP